MVAMLAVLAAISVPLVTTVLAKSRSGGGAEAIMIAIREARGRALSANGWQYRVVGYTGADSNPVRNSFRIEGMDTLTGGVWPDPTAPGPIRLSNQYADRWTSLAQEFGGTALTVSLGGSSFVIAFDSRGSTPPALSCAPFASCMVGFPLSVAAPSGPTKSLAATPAGAVRVY